VIHAAFDAAVHEQPLAAPTEIESLTPSAPTDALVGWIE
jgi:hypothetical protein